MTDPAPLIVVSGPPGSGKTTVAGLAAARLDRSTHILGDHFFRYIRGGWLDPSSPESNDQNRHVVTISANAATGYAQAGYTTFLDGIYGPWFLDLVRAAVGSGVALHYVVLRADLDVSLERALRRLETTADEYAHRTPDDLERVVRVMHEHFDELAQYEPHVIDTTSATPDQVCDQLLAGLESGALRLTE